MKKVQALGATVFLVLGVGAGSATAQPVTEEWRVFYDPTVGDPVGGGTDLTNAMTVDAAGNVYVAGVSSPLDAATEWSWVVSKFDSAGIRLWEDFRKTGPGSIDEALGIAVNESGDVFAVGIVHGASAGDEDFAVRCYDSDGVLRWEHTIAGPVVGSFSRAAADTVVVDSAGNTIVAGSVRNVATGFDMVIAKYDSDTGLLWSEVFQHGSSRSRERNTRVAVGPADSIYVTAEDSGTIVTARYDSAGLQEWFRLELGRSPQGIAVDSMGSVFVVGASPGDAVMLQDVYTLKYSSAGVLEWARRKSGQSPGNDTGVGVAVDSAGNAIVLGQVWDDQNDSNAQTTSYDTDGIERWSANIASGPRTGRSRS